MMMSMGGIRIPKGAIAEITLTSIAGWKITLNARLDTGASMSSIDSRLAAALGFDPILNDVRVIKSSLGKEIRQVVSLPILYDGQEHLCRFNLADRSNLSFPILLGRDFLFPQP